MKILIKIIISLTLILNILNVSANNINPIANKWFIGFSNKIDSKYNNTDEIKYFKSFNDKLELLKIKRNLTLVQTGLVNDLISLSNELIFKKEQFINQNTNKNLINNYQLSRNFKHKAYNKDYFFLENGIWYTYIYSTNLYFETSNQKLNISTLEANKIYSNSSIVFIRDDGKLGFVNDFKIRKLISDDIIFGVTGKYNLLKEIKDDKKKLNYDSDNIFKILKNKSIELTKGKTKKDKIKIIYNYILKTLHYSENYSFDNPKYFSGIHTYANKEGVCEGYVKLFLYMLNFAGIDDVKAIRGYVLDAPDFPKIGHAWVSIGDKYYDPTFDDPIGQTKTKTFGEYYYFGLPHDLFYTNRYEFGRLPSFLKTKSKEYILLYINKRIGSLLYKYKNSGYNLLKPFLLKEKYNINLNKVLDLTDLEKIIKPYNVTNWKVDINGVTKKITNINYYSVNDSEVESILKQLNYNLNGYYLFKWKLDNGNYEYRLCYNVKFK